MNLYYWREDNFKGLADIGESLAKEPDLAAYAHYLTLRERGLRKEALKILEIFIRKAVDWPLDHRKEFVNRLLEIQDIRPEIIDLIPTPLQRRVVLVTLNEWIVHEPLNPVPYRWRGQWSGPDDSLSDLRKAIALDPSEQIARRYFCKQIIRDVFYAAHELPSGYFGSPEGDLVLLDEAGRFSAGLTDVALKATVEKQLHRFRELLNSYRDYVATGANGNFGAWAIANERPYSVH